MNSIKNTGRVVGALFVTVMVTWGIGYTLIDEVLSAPEYLSNIYPSRIQVKIGVLFELIEVAAVIGIAAMMFPIFKKQNEPLALTYLGFRILESTMLVVGAFSPLLLLTLSKDYLEAGTLDTSYYQTLATLFMSAREEGVSLIIAILYGAGALIFFTLLYRSKLIPRFISVWGLIAVPLMLLDQVIFEISGNYAVKISGLPILGLHLGLIEVFLGVWLLVKGFDTEPLETKQKIK